MFKSVRVFRLPDLIGSSVTIACFLLEWHDIGWVGLCPTKSMDHCNFWSQCVAFFLQGEAATGWMIQRNKKMRKNRKYVSFK